MADRKVGAPLKYATVEELEKAIDSYFKLNDDKPTITGLAYHLGFADRRSIYDYKERQEFSYSIKKAMLYIESKHEQRLYEGGSTGSIFWLKSRGWNDGSDSIDEINEKLTKLIPNYFE